MDSKDLCSFGFVFSSVETDRKGDVWRFEESEECMNCPWKIKANILRSLGT
jgi:hypothetical protein